MRKIGERREADLHGGGNNISSRSSRGDAEFLVVWCNGLGTGLNSRYLSSNSEEKFAKKLCSHQDPRKSILLSAGSKGEDNSLEKFGSTLGLKLCVPADEESQRNFNNFLVSLSNDEEVFKNGAFHNGSLNIFGWKLLLMPLEERNEIRLGKEREKEHGRCGRPKA
ncbi:hypothetical protein RUM44_010840 [Polyplax serrata]|uniref:LAGLIDADG homing endonuclease n=1 Tax=Polyplax serrata TaxID=468196 RepID=A0ABR1AQ23_POLSC